MATASVELKLTPKLRYLLRIADTALIHSQRLGEWAGHGPVLEEDIALANMALDLLGQARSLLTHVATLEGQGLDEDALAFLRDEGQFLNFTLAEQPMRRSSAHAPGGDFAGTVLRNFFLGTWFKHLWHALQSSGDAQVAAIAAKALKEARYHQQHSADWVVRLGDGTEESARRLQAALVQIWPYTHELFGLDAVDEAAKVQGLGPTRHGLFEAWYADVQAVFEAARLAVPKASPFQSLGCNGQHSEHMGFILAEMQVLQRAHPGGQW